MDRLVVLSLVCLSMVTCDPSDPIDIENIDSSELTEMNLRRAVSALSLVSESSHSDSASDFSMELLSANKKEDVAATSPDQHRCELITVPMCRNLAYNMTSMPNQFEHTSQSEAAAEAHQFWALVEFNCAAELKFFLCSMYTPICIPGYNKPIKACRSVCSRARFGCERYMKKFGFDWPDHMRCELFPEQGDAGGEVCMDPMDADQPKKPKNQQIQPINRKNKPQRIQPFIIDSVFTREDLIKMELFGQTDEKKGTKCQDPFVPVDHDISTAGIPNCAQPCQTMYFDKWEQEFSSYWVLVWSILCLISSICTTCTFLIEPSRFKYPEKPIIYLSICYLFVSMGYLIRFVVGHERMACEADGSIRSLESSSQSAWPCLISFTLIYYFTMASSVWWCVISLTWFLAAGLKWGSESIAQYRTHFHFVSWSLPLVQTLAILSQSLVDADSLTGICGVGNTRVAALRFYQLFPSSAYLLVGVTFLVAGFIALFKIRRSLIRNKQRRSHKLEKLMIRIGVFSILFTVPATCVIACEYYESVYRLGWERTVACHKSANPDEALCSRGSKDNQKPEFWIFALKYFMSMIIGVTSGFWIWSSKSLNSWRVFLNKMCWRGPVSKLTPNSSEFTEESESVCCMSLKDLFRCDKQLRRKDSIVYFQASDDANKPNLYDMPHNDAYQVPYSSDDFGHVLYKKMPMSSSSNQFYANNIGMLQPMGHGVTGPFYEFPAAPKSAAVNTTTSTNTNNTNSAASSVPSTISTIRR